MFEKIGFWLRSQNRHGIHSPFVYGFLDRTLYARKRPGCTPEQQLLLAAAEHFAPTRVGSTSCGAVLAGWLGEKQPQAHGGQPPYDLFMASQPGEELEALLNDPALWHNDSVVFVGGLREGDQARQAWQRLCSLPQVRVTLETYRAGLLFFRPQQAPQHFRIRLKSSIFKRS